MIVVHTSPGHECGIPTAQIVTAHGQYSLTGEPRGTILRLSDGSAVLVVESPTEVAAMVNALNTKEPT